MTGRLYSHVSANPYATAGMKDTGCEDVKALGYKGTCRESEDYPDGCPFEECLMVIKKGKS